MPSTSPEQAKLMSAIAHGWQPPASMKHAPSLKVAKEFHEADKAQGKYMHYGEGGKVDNLKRIFDWIAMKSPKGNPAGGLYGYNSPGYMRMLQQRGWNPKISSTHMDMLDELATAPSQVLVGHDITSKDLEDLVDRYALRIDDPLVTHRGMVLDSGSLPSRGTYVTRPHMQSVSTDPLQAAQFADPGITYTETAERIPTFTRIQHERGSVVLPQPTSGQDELLLPPGARGALKIEDLMDAHINRTGKSIHDPDYWPGDDLEGVLMDATHPSSTFKPGYDEGGKVGAVKALLELFTKSVAPYTEKQENIRAALNKAHEHLFSDPADPNFKAAAGQLQQVPGSGRSIQRLHDYMDLGAFDTSGFHKNELLGEMAGLGNAHGLDINPEILSQVAPTDATGGGLLQPSPNPFLQPDHTRAVSGYADGGSVSDTDSSADWPTIMARARALNQPTIQGQPGPSNLPPAQANQGPPPVPATGVEDPNLTGMEHMSPEIMQQIRNMMMQEMSTQPEMLNKVKAMQSYMAERLKGTGQQAAPGMADGGSYTDPMGGVAYGEGDSDDRNYSTRVMDLVGIGADRATTRVAGDDAHRTLARVAAGLGSQVGGTDDKGKFQFGRVPGIVYEAGSLPTLADDAASLGRSGLMDKYDQLTSNPAAHAVGNFTGLNALRAALGGLGKLQEKYGNLAPAWSYESQKRADASHKAAREAMGLTAPHGLQENASESLGTMLGQIPIGAAREGESALVKMLKSPAEWLGPTVRPSAGSYLTGAGFGGAAGALGDDHVKPEGSWASGATGAWAEGGRVGSIEDLIRALDRLMAGHASLADQQRRGPVTMTVKPTVLSDTQRDLGPVRTSQAPGADQ